MTFYKDEFGEVYSVKLIPDVCKDIDEAYFNSPELIKVKDCEKKVKKLGYSLERRRGYSKHQYAVDNILITWFTPAANQKWLGNILIYGCFAAYEKNLEISHKFIKDINDNIFKVKMFHLDNEIQADIQSLEEYKREVKKHHAKKYEHFLRYFGDFDELVMADEDFYKRYNVNQREKRKTQGSEKSS